MQVFWYGLSSFKIISRELVIFTNPFGKTTGLLPPRGNAQIVISSDINNEMYNNFSSFGGRPFIVAGPGEYDIKAVFIRGIPLEAKSPQDKNPPGRQAIYSINLEGVNLGFLGSLNQKELAEVHVEELNNLDILFIPVGGNGVCDAEAAVNIIAQLEPKMVIPMHYKTAGITLKLEFLERFLKEMGTRGEQLDRLTIKKNELGEEKTRLVILTPQRT